MSGGGPLFVAVAVYVGWQILRGFPVIEERASTLARGDTLTARELAGLVDVEYEEDLVLVSPRGVELPYSPEWDIDDVLATLRICSVNLAGWESYRERRCDRCFDNGRLLIQRQERGYYGGDNGSPWVTTTDERGTVIDGRFVRANTDGQATER